MGHYRNTLRVGVALGAVIVSVAAVQAQTLGRQAQAAAPAPAQETIALDQINVQGARDVGTPLVAGPTTTETTRAQLDHQQVQSLTDLSNRVEAGITFNRNNNSLNIRGLDGSRVLTTVDGIRQPFMTDTRIDRGSANAFDFDALSTLDLLRGSAGASTLGSGAMAGALAVRTLDPKDLIKGDRNFGALAKTGYDSTDKAWFGSAAVAARLNTTYFLLQGGIRDGHETQNKGSNATIGASRSKPNPTDFTQHSFLGKIQHYSPDEVHRFGLTGEYFKREDTINVLTSAVSATGNYRPGKYDTGDQIERKRLSLSYDFKLPGAFVDEAHATLYWQNVRRNALVDGYRHTSVVGPYGRNNQTEQDAWGFNGHAIKNFQTGMFSHKVLGGVELRMTQLDQYSAGYDNCRRPYTGAFSACNNLHTNQADQPRVDGRMVGLYLQDEIGMLDNRLRLTPGVRFDWDEEKPKDTPAYTNGGTRPVGLPPSSSDSAWSPKIRLEYDLVKNAPFVKDVTAFAQWSKGFRAPAANELYGRFGAVGTYLREGDPTLRPETSNGIDIGVRFGERSLGGSITYFHTNYRNFIDYIQVAPPGGLYPQGGITRWQNVSKVEMQGLEANAQWAFAPNWLARGSFAYTRGTNKDTGGYLNSVPPVQGIVAVAYGTDVWGAEVSAKFAGARNKVASTTGTTQGFQAPGYAVFNASAWWKPTQLADLQFQIGVYNIFDRKYFDAVTVPTGVLAQSRDYYSEPGRTVKATMKYQF